LFVTFNNTCRDVKSFDLGWYLDQKARKFTPVGLCPASSPTKHIKAKEPLISNLGSSRIPTLSEIIVENEN
jgi:hypothetical protein